THASLEGRVKRVTDKPLILINNYIGDPKLDTLFNQLTAEHKHGLTRMHLLVSSP
ncbi:hypothetical protein ACSLN6_19540, partial [Escherichia coli]